MQVDDRARRAAVALSLVAVALGAAATGGEAAASHCKNATVGGKHVCLAAGQVCNRRYNTTYKRYGFQCTTKDSRGRYHLTALSYGF